MKKMYGLVFLCLFLVVASLLSACGGGGGSTVAPTTTQGTPPATTTPFTTTAPEITITTATSSTFEDIPVYPGAASVTGDYSAFTAGISGTMSGVTVEWHFYQIETSQVDDVFSYYSDVMPDNGWQSMLEMDTPGMEGGKYSMYLKGTDTGIIMTFPDPANSANTILGLGRMSV